MSDLKRITVLVTPANFARIKKLAGDVPLSKWIQKRILAYEAGDVISVGQIVDQPGNGSTDGKDNQDAFGVRDIRVARQRAGAARGPRTRGSNRHPNARRGATEDLARDAARDSGIAAVQPSDVAVASETPKRKACKVCGLAFCKGHTKK